MSLLKAIFRTRPTAQTAQAALDAAMERRGVGASTAGGGADEPEQSYRPIDRKLLVRMLYTLSPYWRRYVGGLVLGVFFHFAEMMTPLFMKWVVDFVTGTVDGRADPTLGLPRPIMGLATLAGIDPLGARGRYAMVALIVGVWGATLGLGMLIQRWQLMIMVSTGERVQFSLRKKLFEKLHELSMSFYDKTKLGRIISRCTSDIGSMREMNVWGLNTVAMNALMMGFAAAMLWWTEPRLFLSVAWLGPILFVCNLYYRKRAGTMHQIVREGFTRVSTNIAENITGVRVVTAFNRQQHNLGRFNSLQDINTANNVRLASINGMYLPLLQFIGFIGRVMILLVGGYLVIRQPVAGSRVLSLGAVLAAYMYWDWFMGPVLNFGNFYNQLMQAMAGAERVYSLLDTKPEVADEPDARPLPRIDGRVTFDHVTFGYKADRPVLHDVCFDITPGQTVALVGATGSGKSSIISLIARFYQPQQGRVLVDGHDVRHVIGDTLHKQMGLVLQVNYLFTGTVKENIRYARPTATDEDVIRAAQEIGSYDAIVGLANGFDTEVGERGANMSLGQRQLICFTRAYLADPRIFMLDEATSAVDTATELLVQHSLEKLLAGRTTFIVAHRLSTILRADLIMVVEQGRIVERGNHQSLLEADGKYAALYKQFVHHTG